MTPPAFPAISGFPKRLRAGRAQVVVRARRRLLLGACASLLAFGSPASAQLPTTDAASWGFFEYTPDLTAGLTNASVGRVTGVTWAVVEPVPGTGVYNWNYVDTLVRRSQAGGSNLVLELKTGNGSAFSDPDCFGAVEAAAPTGAFPSGRALASCPMRPEMESAWSGMITEAVERYDGDGSRDMPGLLGTIRVAIEVENEAANPQFWDYGTPDRALAADRYLRLLELSYQAKQAADPGTEVILSGLFQPNILALCDGDPAHSACTPFNLGNVAFTKRVLARPEIFDAVDVHFFVYYHFEPEFIDVGFRWVADQMQQRGYQRPIYSLEWTGSTMMHVRFEGYIDKFRAYFPYSASFPTDDAFQAMYLGLDLPGNVVYRKWFEAEQAKEFGKLFTNILAHGVRRLIHVQYSDYHPAAVWSNPYWNWQGVIKYVGGAPIRKPSYYTFNILSERISGFTGARRIDQGDVRLYEFTFPTGEPTYVVWTEGASRVLDLSSVIARSPVVVTHLVTQLDAANAPVVQPDQTLPATAVPVGDIPVLLKAWPPLVSIDDRSVAEGADANAAFRVTLSAPSSQTVTVAYTTVDGTATAISDYEPTSGTIIFSPGRTSHSLFVPIVTDGVAEGSETFTVTLNNPVNGSLARNTAAGTIGDPPALQRIPMWRAYNRSADYHFFTTSQAEFDNAVANGYRDETTGLTTFDVLSVMQPGAMPLFRLYNPNSGRHYYTGAAGERDVLRQAGWIYERDEGFLYPTDIGETVELFRLYNVLTGTHLFTKDPGEKDAILATFPGIWVQHGSVGYAFEGR